MEGIGKDVIRIKPWTIFLVAAAIIAFRMPERLLHGYLWAEDGKRFLVGAYTQGWHGIFVPYAGYMLVLPRTIATFYSKLFPIGAMPYLFAWTCLVITACSATFLYSVAKRVVPDGANKDIVSASMALSPLVVPHGGEVFLTITNLQWVLCPLLVAVIWDRFARRTDPMSVFDAIVTGGFITVVTISSPFGVMLWPVAALAMVFRPSVRNDPRARIVASIYTIAAAAQSAVLIFSERRSSGPLQSLPWAKQFFSHAVADFFLPVEVLRDLDISVPLGVIVFAFIAWIAIRSRYRYLLWVLGGFAAVIWGSAVAIVNQPDLSLTWYGAGTRYLFLPSVVMAWTFLLAIASDHSRAVRGIALGLLAMMVLTSASRFRADLAPWAITQGPGEARVMSGPGGSSWTVQIPTGPDGRVR